MEQNIDTPPYECEKCDFNRQSETNTNASVEQETIPDKANSDHVVESTSPRPRIQTAKLPDEMVLSICDFLESEDLLAFAEAWPRIADILIKYNVLRTRELQCFCLKKDYMTSKLGIGVSLNKEEKGNFALLGSEFDLLSEDAFELGEYYLT